jgi:hypothetical protein
MKKLIILLTLVMINANIIFSASNVTMVKSEYFNGALVDNILIITNDYIVITTNYLDENRVIIQKETKNIPLPGGRSDKEVIDMVDRYKSMGYRVISSR